MGKNNAKNIVKREKYTNPKKTNHNEIKYTKKNTQPEIQHIES